MVLGYGHKGLSEDLVFRLDLLENAFIIYETLPKPSHDLIISPQI